MNGEQSRCRSCGQPVMWVRTIKGKAMPLDPVPTEAGNVDLSSGRAAVLGPLERLSALGAGTALYMPHHASCPSWPKRVGGKK